MKNGLKFWSLVVIVALIAGFASCSKKDDKKEIEPQIEGRWQLDPAFQSALSPCEYDSYREFLGNGKYRALDVCKENKITDGIWKKEGKRLTIKFDDGTPEAIYSIDLLTENYLTISVSVEGAVVWSQAYKRFVK